MQKITKPRKQLTAARLRELIDYDPKTGIFVWRKRPGDDKWTKIFNTRYAGKRAGCACPKGYWYIAVRDYGLNNASRLAWLYVKGAWPDEEIDHINGNPTDNRIANLRAVSRSQNAINRALQSNNSTGYKGVWKRKGMNSWVANITLKGKCIKLGSFKSPEAAHAAFMEAAKKMHGEFIRE